VFDIEIAFVAILNRLIGEAKGIGIDITAYGTSQRITATSQAIIAYAKIVGASFHAAPS
jgi:hypothetical protein